MFDPNDRLVKRMRSSFWQTKKKKALMHPLKPPCRPGVGTSGTKCIVKANHFLLQLADEDIKSLCHYDVAITPEVSSQVVNRAVMSQLVKWYRISHFGNRLPVYDGRKSLYTTERLNFFCEEFKISLFEDGGPGGQMRIREFKVGIKYSACTNLHDLARFLEGKQADVQVTHKAIQILNIVMREYRLCLHSCVGSSFYSGWEGLKLLRGGVEIHSGFHQTVRPTQMGLSLNIDISSKVFYQPVSVIDFVRRLLAMDWKEASYGPLSAADRVKVETALRGVTVNATHHGNNRIKYRISGLTTQETKNLTFRVDERGTIPFDERGTIISVVEYFYRKFQLEIQYNEWPCLQVGTEAYPNYLPMEVCQIVSNQVYKKRMDETQVTSPLVICQNQNPRNRQLDICSKVKNNGYDEDPFAKEFGIKVTKDMAQVEARILPPPRLKYHSTGRENICLPEIGKWNMMNKKVVNGGEVNNWVCINFSPNLQDNVPCEFYNELARACRISGMSFNAEPVLPPLSAQPCEVESVLKNQYKDAMTKLQPQSKKLDLLLVILPDNNGSLYGDVKRICETDIGIVSQCCLSKHVVRISRPYCLNVALKINVKVGGTNTVLADALSECIPSMIDEPTIIFGADVAHPQPGDDTSPSTAAVVASIDWPYFTKYVASVRAQAHRKELIQDLFKMIIEQLRLFYKVNGWLPQRIIFYRDGISEGQFSQVIKDEVYAIRQACFSLDSDYKPPVTFVVVQKRHRTRLFVNNHYNPRSFDESGNILPGTVVDSKICHPTEFDFYLCSHAGIQGTSRPAHYHVLLDENKFTADALQSLTYNLCYTYARCTRSVSIVPPVYYAHLAARRAQFYIGPETFGSGSSTGGAPESEGMGGGAQSIQTPSMKDFGRPLLALKDDVRMVMFYC